MLYNELEIPIVREPASTWARFTVAVAVDAIRDGVLNLPDTRKGGDNQRYAIGDAGLSAFSVFFMHSPSFLDDERRMQKDRGRNNAGSLFGVHEIASTQQICNLLDPVSLNYPAPVFVEKASTITSRVHRRCRAGAGGGVLAAAAARPAAGRAQNRIARPHRRHALALFTSSETLGAVLPLPRPFSRWISVPLIVHHGGRGGDHALAQRLAGDRRGRPTRSSPASAPSAPASAWTAPRPSSRSTATMTG